MKKVDFSGQSVIEYSAIAVLVMVGILAMGPHVVRSVNAYFKIAQEQAQDSFREELNQSPVVGSENTFNLGPDCQCSLNSYSCGDGVYCAVNREQKVIICSSAECLDEYKEQLQIFQCYDRDLVSMGRIPFDDSAQCFPDCRLDFSDCPVGSSGDSPDVLFHNATTGADCGFRCCMDAESVVPPVCGTAENDHRGEQLMVRYCGPALEAQFFWEENSSLCGNYCGDKDEIAAWCDPVTYNTNVGAGDPIIHVDFGGCEAAAVHCADEQCKDDAWTCMAECPTNIDHVVLTVDTCECEGNWSWENGACVCDSPYSLDASGDCKCEEIQDPVVDGSNIETGGTSGSNSDADILAQLCEDYGYDYGQDIIKCLGVCEFTVCDKWCHGPDGDGACSWVDGDCDDTSVNVVRSISCCFN